VAEFEILAHIFLKEMKKATEKPVIVVGVMIDTGAA
jgi:hypothetical protein